MTFRYILAQDPLKPDIEQFDIKTFRNNYQLEMLQSAGIISLLTGSVLLLTSTIIAIVYVLAVVCKRSKISGNNGKPYIYDGGEL